MHTNITFYIEERELVAWLSKSSWCLVIVVWFFPSVPWVCLQLVIVVFSGLGLHCLSLSYQMCPKHEISGQSFQCSDIKVINIILNMILP